MLFYDECWIRNYLLNIYSQSFLIILVDYKCGDIHLLFLCSGRVYLKPKPKPPANKAKVQRSSTTWTKPSQTDVTKCSLLVPTSTLMKLSAKGTWKYSLNVWRLWQVSTEYPTMSSTESFTFFSNFNTSFILNIQTSCFSFQTSTLQNSLFGLVKFVVFLCAW